MRLSLLLVSAVMLTATSCASPKFVGRPGLTLVNNTALPPPTTIDLTADMRPQILGPLDQISVEVVNVPDLTRVVRVDSQGQVALPLAGTLAASGKTPEELSAIIRDRMRAFVRSPEVVVNVVQVVSQVVTVDGEVRMPGQYPVTGRMTLMRSIASAQGVTEFAKQNYVVIFRRVGQQDMAALYDLRAIRQGLYDDPEVFSSDVIFVGESRARRVFRDIIQASGLITAPLVAVVRN